MKEQLISFETAKLAQEKGFDYPCNIVFDLQDDNKEVNFYEQACIEFIEDCETGYRDKALNYFKEDCRRTDNNKDLGYYITRPTQSLLQQYLRENNIIIEINLDQTSYPKYCFSVYKYSDFGNWEEIKNPDWGLYGKYEEALEDGLKLSLKSM